MEHGPKHRKRVREVVWVQINTTSSGTSSVGGAAAQTEEQPGEPEEPEEAEARGEGREMDGGWDCGQSEKMPQWLTKCGKTETSRKGKLGWLKHQGVVNWETGGNCGSVKCTS